MGRSRRELLDSMSAVELTYWRAYERVEPWGEERADLRSALAATGMMRCLGAKVKVADLMPVFDGGAREARGPEPWQVMRGKLAALCGTRERT